MKFNKQLIMVLAISLSFGFVSCSDDDKDDNPTNFTATQANLNAANKTFELNITGDKYGASSVGHDGGSTSDITFRDVYSNLSSNSAALSVGSIITKKVYGKNNDGTKNMDDLRVAFAMIKREAGYDDANGNWEYVMIPFDPANNYTTNPFGLLPEVSNTNQRGKLAMCIGCHNTATGGDFLFVR